MSFFFPRFLSLSIFLFCCHYSSAQQQYFLEIKSEIQDQKVLQKYRISNVYPDSLQLRQSLRAYVRVLQDDGYLLATLKDLKYEGSQVSASINVGERFEWLGLSEGNIDAALLRRIGFRDRTFRSKPFRHKEIARLQGALLNYAEQNGFPFANLSFDSLRIEQNHFAATLNFDEGPPINFDSLSIEGNTRINPKFMSRYLGIVMGEPYDQRRLDNMGRILSSLPYLRVASNPRLTFQNSEARVILNLESRRINQIDGIIGFLPNSSNNQLVVTGQFDIELYNPLGQGRHIGIHWQKLQEKSQSLAMQYEQPNVFKGPLDLATDFTFLKEDTLFTNRKFRLEFDYRLDASSSLSAFTDLKTTNLLATAQYAGLMQLPDLVDFDFTAYGLRFEWQRLDDAFLPKSGIRVSLEGSAGNKKIRQNTGIAQELYQGVQLKTRQYEVNLSGEKYWELGNQFVLVNRLKMGKVFNDRLFRNDAYRLGGFNSIRGFNENFFFATSYAFLTTEARLFLDEFSYLSLFADLARIQSKFEGVNKWETPIGLGAGISFSTNAGIFNFVYAVGSSGQGGINLSQSKIHFGYVSRF